MNTNTIIQRNRKLKQASLRIDIAFLEAQKEQPATGKVMLENARRQLEELENKFGKLA